MTTVRDDTTSEQSNGNSQMNLPNVPPENLISQIYGDLAKPGVRQVGKAISAILGLGNTALFPIYLLNERTKIALENNLENYRKKMENTPEDEVCEVASEIGVPIAEKLAYVSDMQLRDLYTELLAKASRAKEAHLAHPSFVSIINNLSPDEAILLKRLKTQEVHACIEIHAKDKDSNKYLIVKPIEIATHYISDLQSPENDSAYYSNLIGLGILSIRLDKAIAINTVYDLLEEAARVKFADTAEKMNRVVSFRRGTMEVTPFGRLFMQACTSPTPSWPAG